MKIRRHRIITQLESELDAAEKALADHPTNVSEHFNTAAQVDAYWYGRIIGLTEALHQLKKR